MTHLLQARAVSWERPRLARLQRLSRAFSERDRRTLATGTVLVLALTVGARGIPAWRRWDREQRTTAADVVHQLGLATSDIARLPRLRDSVAARRFRFESLGASLLQASNAADAGARLASLVSHAADAAGVRPLGISVRPDSARGVLARVAVRVAAIGDVEGLVDFVNEIEQSEMLLAIRELAVEQPDVAAPATKPETLRIELLIEALAILTAPGQPEHPKSKPRSRIGPSPHRLEIGRTTSSRPSGATADSLAAAAEATIANDPFRLARVPAALRFGDAPAVLTLNPVNAPRPALTLRAIVGGPPWQAVLDGLPGQPGGTVVRPGAVFETVRVSAITSDTVVVQGSDTVWKLTVKRERP